MARTKGWIWFTLALVCALSAGGLTYYLLQRQNTVVQEAVSVATANAQVATPVVMTVQLPVAARDLERGATLTAQDVVLSAFPVELVPTVAISEVAQISGKILLEPIAKGDIFRERAFVGGSSVTLSAQITPGKTVIAFPIVDLFSGTGLFVAGDRVDLLLTRSGLPPASDVPGDSGSITGYSVQNVRVLRVLSAPPSQDNPNPAPTALLLELSPADAVMVKKVKDAGGQIDLALRSPVDDGVFPVNPVTDRDLLQLMNSTGSRNPGGTTP